MESWDDFGHHIYDGGEIDNYDTNNSLNPVYSDESDIEEPEETQAQYYRRQYSNSDQGQYDVKQPICKYSSPYNDPDFEPIPPPDESLQAIITRSTQPSYKLTNAEECRLYKRDYECVLRETQWYRTMFSILDAQNPHLPDPFDEANCYYNYYAKECEFNNNFGRDDYHRQKNRYMNQYRLEIEKKLEEFHRRYKIKKMNQNKSKHAPGTVGYQKDADRLHGTFKLNGNSPIENGRYPENLNMSPLHYFYAFVLQWDCVSALEKKISIVEVPDVFNTVTAYYSYWRKFAMEEARSIILNGLRRATSRSLDSSPGSSEWVNLELILAGKNIPVTVLNSQLVSAKFKIMNSQPQWSGVANLPVAELMRPGNIYQLKLGNNALKEDLTGEKGAEPKKDPIVLATVDTRSHRNHGFMQLIFSKKVFFDIAPGNRRDSLPWVLRLIGSVISEQRVFATCQSRPRVAFIDNVLQRSRVKAKHIHFDANENMIQPQADEAEPECQSSSKMSRATSHDRWEDENLAKSRLNKSQRIALTDCLSILKYESNFSQRTDEMVHKLDTTHVGQLRLVHGPPGCGKTHFLTALLRKAVLRMECWKWKPNVIKDKLMFNIAEMGRRNPYGRNQNDAPCESCLLVCAPSNKAVNVLLEQYLTEVLGSNLCNNRICLIGVAEKLNCSSEDKDEPPMTKGGHAIFVQKNNSQEYYLDNPRKSHAMLHNILYPKESRDAFVYTLSERFADVVAQMISDLNEGVVDVLVDPTKRKFMVGEHDMLCKDITITRSELLLQRDKKTRRLVDNVKAVQNVFEAMEIEITDQLAESYHAGSHALSELCVDSKEALIQLHGTLHDLYSDENGCDDYWSQLYADNDEHVNAILQSKDSEDPKTTKANWCKKQGLARDTLWGLQVEFGHFKRSLLILRDSLLKDDIVNHMVCASLNRANIVFCTLTQAGSRYIANSLTDRVDSIFVDEAGQSSEAALLISYSLMPKNMVLVGDPMQLPAFISSDEGRVAGCSQSLMDRLIKPSIDYQRHLLDTQYRMHPDISVLPNRVFYGGMLKNAEIVRTRPNIIIKGIQHYLAKCKNHDSRALIPPFLQHPFSFVDVKGAERLGGSHASASYSISNVHEAIFISTLCKFLNRIQTMDLQQQVCIITFYTAQVGVIKNELTKQGLRHMVKCVSTVDSFQGSEADIVILSFVRSNPNSNVGFVKNMQRLNVSITRSRYLLVCVGNANTMGNASKSNEADAQTSFGKKLLSATSELVNEAKRRNVIYPGEAMQTYLNAPTSFFQEESLYEIAKKQNQQKQQQSVARLKTQEDARTSQPPPPPPPPLLRALPPQLHAPSTVEVPMVSSHISRDKQQHHDPNERRNFGNYDNGYDRNVNPNVNPNMYASSHAEKLHSNSGYNNNNWNNGSIDRGEKRPHSQSSSPCDERVKEKCSRATQRSRRKDDGTGKRRDGCQGYQ